MIEIIIATKSKFIHGLKCRYNVWLVLWLSLLHPNYVTSFGSFLPVSKSCFPSRPKRTKMKNESSFDVVRGKSLLFSSTAKRNNEFDLADFQDGLETFDDYKKILEALASVTSTDNSAALKAEELFSQMKDDDALRPTTEIHNLVMNSWAFSRSPAGPTRAEEMLDEMEETSDDAGISVTGGVALPDVESYMAVMDGYINQNQVTKAVAVFQRLQDRYVATNFDEKLRPNTSSYNRLIKAWRKSERNDAYLQAERIFQEMMESNDEDVRPNTKTFALLITTLAHVDGERNSSKKARELYDRMVELYESGDHDQLKPDTLVLNALIKVHARSRTRNKGTKVLKIFTDMVERWKSGDPDVVPNEFTFVNTLKALANPKEKNVAEKVDSVLDAMREITTTTPSVKVYNNALKALAFSRDVGKARIARDLLLRISDSDDDDDVEPDRRTYNLVMQACAFTNPEFASEKERAEACKIAASTFRSMRETVGTDHVTYGLFLKVCGNLMDDDADDGKRERAIEHLFRLCCEDGTVSEFVLSEFVEAASDELREKILGTASDSVEPLSPRWSCNLNEEVL